MDNTLLTAKQAQDLLKVDRTTIYRMLKDGRLNGVKVGQQWRFFTSEVNEMLAGVKRMAQTDAPVSVDVLPLHCMQPVQDVFGEIAEVGTVTTDREGKPLTRMSNSCDFCKLILGTDAGRQGCMSSWRKLAELEEPAAKFSTCHAGLQYARAPIKVNGSLIALLIAGQFHTCAPTAEEEKRRIHDLAEKFSINETLLTQAAQQVSVLDDRKISQLGNWLEDVARTFEDISSERADLMGRLKQISEMSVFES